MSRETTLSYCGFITNQNKNSDEKETEIRENAERPPESMEEQKKSISPEQTSGSRENGV